MTNYEQQAVEFLKKADAKIKIEFVGFAINRQWNEKEKRPLYNVTISTPKGEMNFDFWDSIHNTEEKKAANLNEYDILACLTKYDPGTFEDFCFDYGYDTDSRSAEKLYFSVCNEYHNLCRIFTADQMDELSEIN